MTDLSLTIAPKSDQLNADDLIGGPKTITITRVSANPDSAEQPISIFFEGDNGKPFKPCKSMRRVLVQVWGKDGTAYPGRAMILYRDPKVQFGGLAVGGIRISHMTNIAEDVTMALTATRASRKPYTVKPLAAPKPAAKDDPAAKWTAAYLAKLATLTDPPARQEFITARAGKLEELRGKRPELAAEIDLALADAAPTDTSFEDDFGLSDGTATGEPTAEAPPADDDAAPSSAEGPGDEQRGEAFNSADDHPAREVAAKIVSAFKIARDEKGLDNVRSKYAADIDAMPDDIRSEVEEAARVARERMAS